MKRTILIAALMLGAAAQAQVVDTNAVYKQELQNQQEAQRREAEAKQQERDRYEAQRQADMAQAAAERQARAEAKAAKKQARKDWYKEIGRRPRLMLDVPMGAGLNTKSFSMADEYSSVSYDFGLGVLWTYPVARHWDLQAGLTAKYGVHTFTNSVRYDATTERMVPQTLDGWRAFNSSVGSLGVVVPLHVSYVESNLIDIYFGLNAGYSFASFFGYSRIGDDGTWQANDAITERNIKDLNPWRLEVALGVGDRWGIMSGSVELYFNLLPTWRAGSNLHEFGARISF